MLKPVVKATREGPRIFTDFGTPHALFLR